MKTKRIEYIDAMRGFTMILVVYAHVEIFGFFNFGYETVLGQIFQAFRMPLFFFTSGFVTYRAGRVWDCLTFKGESIRRIRIQLVPTLVFGLIYTYFFVNKDIMEFLYSPAKCGYWFTISLLEILLFYYLYSYSSWRLRWNEKKWSVGLICVAFICYVIKMPMKLISQLDIIGNCFCLHYTFAYLQYFVFGVIVSKYREKIGLILDNGNRMAIIIISFVLIFYLKLFCVDLYQADFQYKVLSTIMEAILGYAGICIVFGFFRKNKEVFGEGRAKWLKYIGKRTLDIYMIHYFLLPKLPCVGDFFKSFNNPVIELFLGISLSLMIVALCLLISNVLRISDTLAYYLFGQKKGEVM